MATYGVIGSPTYAVAIPDLPGMLSVLPDNSANQISAQDVRDVIAGLYEGLSGLSGSVIAFASASVYYQNTNLTSVSVGGIPLNYSFTGSSIQTVLDTLFYPYTSPVLSLSVTPNLIEFGNVSTTVALYYSVTAGRNTPISSDLYRPLQSPQPVNLPIAFGATSGIVGGNSILPNSFTVFTYSLNDTALGSGGINSVTASLSYSLRRYWGTLPGSSSLISVTSSTFSYLDVTTLSSELNGGYTQSRQIMTNSDYVVFVWPTNSVNLQSMPPKIYVNGMANNSWIKTRDNIEFTNQFGYTASYDVWRFNNTQGNFTSSYIITT